ncbi:MAG TPA: ABC transporter permease [Bryobacteraceae bacterium]|nr:ABC transporter permease [Bryobacteraceae bacterium]
MDTLLKDLKHSLRMFRENPGFTLAAVSALTVGVGLNTAIFSVVNAVLLKPPPFADPDRIVMFMNTSPGGQGPAASPAKFNHWRAQTSVVQDVSVFRTGVLNLTGGDVPEQVRSGQVSADFFKLFGVPLAQGRGFTHEEDLPNGPHVTLISEGLWRRRFGGDANILGRTILLGGDPHLIVGVVGSGFDFRDFGPQPDVWVPFQLDPNSGDQGHYFQAAGRLKPGVTLQQARAQIVASAAAYLRKYPRALGDRGGFSIEPLRDALTQNVRQTLLIMGIAVAFVLLIACSNVANLLLARAIGRKREIAIRTAMGAGRGRLVRQLLTESLMLSAAGAAIGSALGVAGIRALLMVNTANLPRVGRDGALVTADWRVLAFTVLAALITALLFGLIPALQVSRADLNAIIKEGGGRSGSGLRHNRARTALVISEIALAMILVIGAALLIRTSLALQAVKPGFDPHNVLTMRMSLAGKQYTTSAAIDRLSREGMNRIAAMPGVTSASTTCCVPLEGGYGLPFLIVGRPLTNGPFHGGGGWQTISPRFFDVYKIPVLRGRAFTQLDNAAGNPVVVINEAMAKKFWPKSDPLNDRIWIGKGIMAELAAETPRQIIGVVGDVRDGALNRDPQPVMYVPNAQVPDALNALNVRLTPLAWVVRSSGDPTLLSSAIQDQLRQLSGLPVSDVRTMDEVVSRSLSREKFNMLLMSVFGGAALFLAAIGVYGLMAYSVQQRTQEIGIRMALGAEAGDVRKMVLKHGLTFSLIGVLVGGTGAALLAQFISTFLYGVKPWDPTVFVAVPLILTLIAVIAVIIPATRATRVDPMTALRYE